MPVLQKPKPNTGMNACTTSNSALLRGTAAVVRHGRPVLNRLHFNSDGGEGADGRFAAGAGSADAHFDGAQSIFFCFVGGSKRGLLGGEGSALARSAEAQRSG